MTAVVFAALAAVVTGCRANALPDRGARTTTLVRLDGPPEPNRDPVRLRVLVADIGFGLTPGSDADADVEHVVGNLERFARHAAAFRPDLVVLFDAPVAGDPFRPRPEGVARLGLASPPEAVAPAELLAVEMDRYYRVETVTLRGRPAGRGERIAGGPLVLAEGELSDVAHELARGSTVGSLETPASWTTFTFTRGAAAAVSVAAHDGTAGDAAFSGLEVVRATAACIGEVANASGHLCISLPDGWEILRSTGDANFDGTALGGAIRLEAAAAQLAPAERTQ